MKIFRKKTESEETPEQLSSETFLYKKKQNFEQLKLEPDSLECNQDELEKNNKNEANKIIEENDTAEDKKQTLAIKKNQEKKTNQFSELLNPNEVEQLEEAEEKVKKQGSKKKKWFNFFMLLLNIGVVVGILAYQLSSEDMDIEAIGTVIKNLNWGIIFLILIVFAFLMFLETLKFWILIWKTTKHNRPALSYKVSSVGKYYDALTPLASGGQPFQIYYMNKRGLTGSQALSVCMGKYVIQQIAYIIFTFIIMILSISLPFDSIGATVVSATSWVGFALNFSLIFIIALISINKKVGDKLVSGFLKFFHKIKIIKNYDKQYQKIQKVVSDYQTTMKKFAKEKATFFSQLALSFLFLFFHYCIPFLIYAAFYGFNFELFGQIFIYCVMIDLAVSFMPMPGGTGASELSFLALFASLFGKSENVLALLIWRFFTYYIYIVQGLFTTLYDYFRGNKKFEWTKKRWALEAESREFEEREHKEFELSLAKKLKKQKNKNKN